MRYMPSRITARRRNSTRPPAGGTSGPRGCSTRVRTARKWSAAPWPSSCAATTPRAPSSPPPRRRCRKPRGGAAGGPRTIPTPGCGMRRPSSCGLTATHGREPDLSIWGPRQEPKHFVFSKVMAWGGLNRGARIAADLGLPGDTARWQREAELVHAEVLERGWDPVRQTFVQVYGEPQLDAALLVIPKVRFLPRADPRVRSTIAAVRRELATSCEELIYRYKSPDGLGGDEGAFLACSFWLAQTLAMAGDFDEGERLFHNLLRRANPLGLFAEEIDPATGEQLGNFPQGLSHAALINTAYVLERLRPKGD